MTETEFSEKIYKKDSSGNIRVLHVYTEGADLIQESGMLEGKKVEHRSTCTPKNVGRANATTAEEQARSEARSKIDTKMSTGYFKTIEEAEEKGGSATMLPMLAKSYDKEVKKIDWALPVYVQPKLDGMRCMVIIEDGDVTLLSRKGKVIDTVPHINNSIAKVGLTNSVLDGELYAHGKSFQENMKLIKKYREGETEEVVFHIYDVVEEIPYDHRYGLIRRFCNVANTSSLQLIECAKIYNEDQLKNLHSKYVGEGYEGSIVRHGLSGYAVNKRDSQLLKYKDFHDIALPIKDVIPGDKNPNHGYFIYDWKGAKGHPLGDDILGSGMKFSHKEREDFLLNKEGYIGKTGEVRFFEYSDEGVPRFPVTVGIRLDK